MMCIFKKFLILIFMISLFNIKSVAKPLEANVSKEGMAGTHRIIDAQTNMPIKGAKITLPQKNYSTMTNSDGAFDLRVDITGETILSVEKNGYNPFSLTVNKQIVSRPMIIGVEKTSPMSLVVDTDMFHLGDDNYSEMSANAGEFRVKSVGSYYTKKVKINNFGNNIYLVIGSIIGIDTKLARSMGQNKISYAYASAPEIYFNGNKIAEIQLNGDGQRFKIPQHLVKFNQFNEITIKTGRNLMQTLYIDYDDIEFMNLVIESN